MIKNVPISILLFILLSGSCTNYILAQEFDYNSIKDQVDSRARIVTWIKQIKINVKSPAKYTERVRHVYTIINQKAGTDDQRIYYNAFRKIKNIDVSIIDQHGKKIRSLRKKEIRDANAYDGINLQDDLRYKSIEISHNQYPYTVDLSYKIEHSSTQGYPNFDILTFDEYLLLAEYELNLPSTLDCHYRNIHTDIEPEISDRDGKRLYTWRAENLPLVESEVLSPVASKILPMIYINPVIFEAAGHVGKMDNWHSFGDFIYRLNMDRITLSPELAKEVHRLVKDVETNKEKIEILYKYVQDNTRYVSVQLGIGGWQTFDAAYVEENQYGDCKALSNFTMALLDEVGIKSNTALVTANEEGVQFSEDFVNSQFNHMILYVPEEDMWLECTGKKIAPGYLGSSTENKATLIIDEHESIFTRTPAIDINDNTEHIEATVSISSDGKSTLEGTIRLTGTLYEHINRYNLKDAKEVEEYILDQINISNYTLIDNNISIDNANQQAEISFKVTTDRFGSKSGKRMFLPLTIFQKMSYVPPKDDNRIFDIEGKHNYIESCNLKFQLPENYAVESVPKLTEIANELGEYMCEVTNTESGFNYSRKFIRKSLNLPKEKYEDVRNSYIQISKMDKSKAVITQITAP